MNREQWCELWGKVWDTQRDSIEKTSIVDLKEHILENSFADTAAGQCTPGVTPENDA